MATHYSSETLDLSGAWTKIRRADVHLSTLHERIQSFLDSDPNEVEIQSYSETGEVAIYAEPRREPPVLEWSAIIGDVVHNLRSALDHLVWSLTVHHQPSPPPTLSRQRVWVANGETLDSLSISTPAPGTIANDSSRGPRPKT